MKLKQAPDAQAINLVHIDGGEEMIQESMLTQHEIAPRDAKMADGSGASATGANADGASQVPTQRQSSQNRQIVGGTDRPDQAREQSDGILSLRRGTESERRTPESEAASSSFGSSMETYEAGTPSRNGVQSSDEDEASQEGSANEYPTSTVVETTSSTAMEADVGRGIEARAPETAHQHETFPSPRPCPCSCLDVGGSCGGTSMDLTDS